MSGLPDPLNTMSGLLKLRHATLRTIIPTNYNYLQLLQIMSGLSDPLHTHMTGLAKLLHEMTFITTFHHKWTIEATSRR